jgi:4-amino-4-deoxy-L-arabinose transferase-like glycosyltransferase
MQKYFIGLLLGVALFAVFAELGRMDVVSDNEGQRTAPPAEMLRSGDYLIPTINGQTYLNKPPLLYWGIAGVYRLTGRISALTARIPTAVSFVILVALVYALVRRGVGETAARWTGLALAATPFPLQMARTAELDVPLTLATFLAVMGFRQACYNAGAKAAALAVASGLALGAAILLKGPVPFLFLVPAWIAWLVTEGSDPGRAIRSGIRWTVVALGLGFVEMGLQLLGLRIGFPLGLSVFGIAWIVLAWRHGSEGRGRSAGLLLVTCLVGVAVAAPWALAVLNRLEWEYLRGLLFSQVTERTYTASSINSGSPLFFVFQLVGMLAPWSLLLPLHFSRGLWQRNSGLYRFALLGGWLSVGVFSLIAGKETEYILPAVPLLLIPTGVHIAQFLEGTLGEAGAYLSERVRALKGAGGPEGGGVKAAWLRLWVRALLVLLPLVLVGGLVYAAVEEPHAALLIELAVFALLGIGAAVYGWRRAERRFAVVYVLVLLTVVGSLLVRSFHYTGAESPQALARLVGRLVEAGYEVEAAKVYPAFAFYAGAPVPEQVDPVVIHEKLTSPQPYFYVAREKFLPPNAGREAYKILTPTFTNKDLLLIGNRELPEIAKRF